MKSEAAVQQLFTKYEISTGTAWSLVRQAVTRPEHKKKFYAGTIEYDPKTSEITIVTPECEWCGKHGTKARPIAAYFVEGKYYHDYCFERYAESVRR